MTSSEEGSTEDARADRIAAAVFGALFVGVGALILVLTPMDTLWPLALVLVVTGLGLESIASAALGKRSLLSRLGPLP